MRPRHRNSSRPTASRCVRRRYRTTWAITVPSTAPIAEPAGDRPHDVERDPSHPAFAELMEPQQPEAEHDQRECASVVEAGLARQREPQLVAIGRVLDLDVGGQDGIGRREDCAENHGSSDGQPEQGGSHEGDETHGDEHRHRGEANRSAPAAVPDRVTQLEPGREQRHDDGELGDELDQAGVGDGVEADEPQPDGPDDGADPKVDDRCRDGQAPQDAVGQCHDDEHQAGRDEPAGVRQRVGHARAFPIVPVTGEILEHRPSRVRTS